MPSQHDQPVRPRTLANPAILALGLALVACAGPREAAPLPPPVRLSIERFLGTPFSGPRMAAPQAASAATEAVDSESEGDAGTNATPWTARARFGLLVEPPPADLEPLAAQATLVTDSGVARPIRGVPRGLAAARIAAGFDDGSGELEEASPARGRGSDDLRAGVRWLGAVEAPLSESTTTALTLWSVDSGKALAGVEYFAGDGRAPTWALFAPNASAAEDRLHFTQAPMDEADPALIFAPLPAGLGFGTVVIETVLRSEPAAEEAAQLAVTIAREIPIRPRTDLELANLLAELGDDRSRPALALLSVSVDAPTTADLALVADDALLQKIGSAAKLEAAGSVDRAHLALVLERASLLSLAELKGSKGLERPLEAVILRHAGELGNLPSALGGTVRAAQSHTDLLQRLASENRLLLEDPNPASRRRALQWLDRRGLAPANFDPLGARDARRDALEVDRRRRTAENGS